MLLVVLALVIDTRPLIPNKPALDGTQANIARGKAKMLADGLASADSKIYLNFNGSDIEAISATLSHMFDNTQVGLGYSPTLVQGASSTALNLGLFKIYMNIYCEISSIENLQSRSKVSKCNIGDFPLPGIVVEALLYGGLTLVFDSEVAKTIDSLISNVRVENKELFVSANKSIDFKERVNDTLNDASSLAKMAIQTSIPDSSLIQIYLDDLKIQAKNEDMAAYIKNSMQLASIRSTTNDPVLENRAALWAWGISFGSPRFARLAGITDYDTNHQVTLRGRRDLAQHFIYSAIISSLTNSGFSSKAGELKEILDSGKGGTGFSFADLLADNAGIAFAQVLTENNESAINSQNHLAKMNENIVFFPFVHDLPEGMSENKFKRIFKSADSTTYLEFVDSINKRLDALILYSGNYGKVEIEKSTKSTPRITPIKNGFWQKIDTHVHSKYSDGAHSIAEIAAQSERFGCNAIAITDHGDKQLKGVLSDDFFRDIDIANSHSNGMVVMPGLEWNIPPFNGREHATLLLPSNTNLKKDLKEFRTLFDHYHDYYLEHLSAKFALQWINDRSRSSSTKPLIIYNHPSRKDFRTNENYFDINQWQSYSSSVIGMSGSPGHQKKRGVDNGSYEFLLRTLNGLDPTVRIGGEWDKLLQKGNRVLSARANSDFHNTSMDYWPCQFSSTHTFSESNAHNDILKALMAGKTWAQHGQFVKYLSFDLVSKGRTYSMGESVNTRQAEDSTLLLTIILNDYDWQDFPTSLDELQLVVVTEDDVSTIDLSHQLIAGQKRLVIEQKFNLPENLKALRIIGRSVQPELHDYMVFTNPIFVNEDNF